MPPRTVTAAIVLFWLLCSGWFFQHEIWPRLQHSDGAPFTIDLAAEAEPQPLPRRWQIFHNGQTVGFLLTSVVHHPGDDTYAVVSKAHFDRFGMSLLGAAAQISTVESVYRVSADGQLRDITCHVVATVVNPDDTRVQVTGSVEQGRFAPHWHLDLPFVGKHDLDTDPVEVPAQHSMLTPMQPWNRLLNVREDTRWQIALFDPLSDSLSSLLPGKNVTLRYLEAGVKQGTDTRFWNGSEVPCLVIEYRGENLTGRTWVRQTDGLVLRQEAERGDERMALERELK